MDTHRSRIALHPLHAILLSFPVALFAATIATDIAFLNSSEIQWSNFSAWLNAGGLAFGGLTLGWAVAATILSRRTGRRSFAYPLLLAAMWVVGFLNALLHSRDAWYSVTAGGLLLSALTALLALVAGWLGFRGFEREMPR